MMRALLLALLATTSGCFTSWAVTQAVGGQRTLDEGVREERVPQPDVHERLHVMMPFVQRYATATPDTTTDTAAPFECRSSQSATDAVYRSNFRYGGRWKKVAAAMFLIEAGIAAAVYFAGDRAEPGAQLTIGFFGLDAIGTAALIFVPRKEIYRRDVLPVHSSIRNDCPAGIVVEIAGETFPVDAAGQIGELGDAALASWRRDTNAQPVRVTYGQRTFDVRTGMSATFEVPMGTLTQAD